MLLLLLVLVVVFLEKNLDKGVLQLVWVASVLIAIAAILRKTEIIRFFA
jgi:hypothetical protein